VLDTWFSSALWPFSTLGWPEDTKDVERYYPTEVLVTGFDIIFFWVARMMMMGLHFMKDVPFPTSTSTPSSRREGRQDVEVEGQSHRSPASDRRLRRRRAALHAGRDGAQGRDIKLAAQRVEGYRNFATKLWNACRFAEMNACALPSDFDPTKAKQTLNRWIAHETARATREVTEAIEAYRFNDAAGSIYRFVWNVYCDWYLELAKPVLMGEDGAAKSETRAMVAWARDEILKLLHPFMPFITEELWAVTAADAEAASSSPSPLVGGGRGGGVNHRLLRKTYPPLHLSPTAVQRTAPCWRYRPGPHSKVLPMTPPKPRSAGSWIS
jgi:valyl-tRNA synthetase